MKPSGMHAAQGRRLDGNLLQFHHGFTVQLAVEEKVLEVGERITGFLQVVFTADQSATAKVRKPFSKALRSAATLAMRAFSILLV